MTKASTDSESSVPELLQRFEQELLQAPDHRALVERYERSTRNWPRPFGSWPKRSTCSRRPRSGILPKPGTRGPTLAARRGSAPTGSSGRSAGEAWARCTRRSKSRLEAA